MASRRTLLPGNDLQVCQVDALLEPRVVERDLDTERPEALDTLQFPEFEVFESPGQITKALKIFDVRPVFQRLAGLAVDDGHFPGLRHALGRPLDNRLVDSLLDDLVPDVIRAIDVEPLFVEAKPDREGGVLDEDQVRRVEQHPPELWPHPGP